MASYHAVSFFIQLTALSCCWQKSILSWKTFSMEKLLWKDWDMFTGVLELLVRLARCKLSIRPSMKWSLVRRTLWWARTQLSQRYSWQSRQCEVAGLPSSQELHRGSERCWGLRRPPWWTTEEDRPFLPCSSAETTTSSRLLKRKLEEGRASTPDSDNDTFWSHVGHLSFRGSPGFRWPSRHCLQKACRQGKTCSLLVDEVDDELEVWEEEEEVDELEEIGAEQPHSSLHSGHVCRSESGKDAICADDQRITSDIKMR